MKRQRVLSPRDFVLRHYAKKCGTLELDVLRHEIPRWLNQWDALALAQTCTQLYTSIRGSMEYLFLSWDEVPCHSTLQKFSNLRRLTISCAQGSTCALALPQLTKLTNLKIFNAVRLLENSHLHPLVNLTSLDLSNNTQITNDGLKTLTALTTLHLSHRTEITSLASLTRLSHLTLNGLIGRVPDLVNSARGLTHLELRGCSDFNPNLLTELPQPQRLVSLTVINDSCVDDQVLVYFSATLKSLDMWDVDRVTMRGLDCLAKTLTKLRVGCCLHISNQDLIESPVYKKLLDV